MSADSADEIRRVAALEGRVAFGVVTFALAGALVALVDRVGAPEHVIVALGPAVLVIGLVTIGVLCNAMRLSSFYAAGRGAPAAYAGMAAAGVAAGLLLPVAVAPRADGILVQVLATAFIGLAGAALVVGPLLRKTGAYSLTDLLAARFPNRLVRLIVAASVALASCLAALAAYEAALRAAQDTLGLSRAASTLLGAIIVIAIVGPGGAAGVIWGSVAALGVLAGALALILALVLWNTGGLPLPGVGGRELWLEALAHMEAWSPAAKAPAITLGSSGLLVLAIGLACLAPLLTPAIGARDASAARRGGFAWLAWTIALAVAVAAVLAATALAAPQLLVGLRPEALPGFVYEAAGRGLLKICGAAASTPRAALAACEALPGFKGVLTNAHVWASPRYLLAGASELRGFTFALSGALAAGLMGVGLMACAAAVHTAATAIANDAFGGVREGARIGAHASLRLAATRVWMAGLALTLALMEAGLRLDPLLLIALAAMVSTIVVAPLLMLSLWPRATAADGMIAVMSGLCAAALVAVLDVATLDVANHATLSATTGAHAGLTGFGVALVAGLLSSLRRTADEARPGRVFLEGLLHGRADMLNTDRGA